MGGKKSGQRPKRLSAVNNGKAISRDAFRLPIGTIEIMNLKTFAVCCQAVVQVEKMLRFFFHGFKDLVIDFGASFICPDIGVPI